ncbi:hypothetical protein D6821_02480 [Candidatus Parcubacteria bacterium]|nr:MAG: hypothetical protein D6821_02480 [Candidatus Parcubacteria bacterium]
MSKKSLLLVVALLPLLAGATSSLAQKLAGRILLQVEAHGEAWYVNPTGLHRYYLGRPEYAWKIMRDLSTGISNDDLAKIPIGILNYNAPDKDGDGLADNLEEAIGTNPQKKDTDGDGYSDQEEIANNFNPAGDEKLPINLNFARQQAGKIFLQTESRGEAWYVNPNDLKRYYLGRPHDAFAIMRQFSLGISDANLKLIPVAVMVSDEFQPMPNNLSSPSTTTSSAAMSAQEVIQKIAHAFNRGDKNLFLQYAAPTAKKALEYSWDYLNEEGRKEIAVQLNGAQLTKQGDNQQTFAAEVFFSYNGSKHQVNFVLEQQENKWLLTNL